MNLVFILALCTIAVTKNVSTQEVSNVNKIMNRVGPISMQMVSAAGNPDEFSSEVELLDGAIGRSLIEETIKNVLEGLRDVVINGNDDLPPLDPFIVDTLGPYEYTNSGVRARASINNLRAEGLRWYVVDSVNFNALRLALGAHVTLPWIIATGSYDAEARVAVLLTHRAAGNFRIFINRLEVGVDARLGTNLIGGHLLLRQLDIKIDIHDTLIQIDGMTGSSLINTFISSFIQSLTQEVIQTEMGNVSQLLSQELFDVINDFLKDYTLNDILG